MIEMPVFLRICYRKVVMTDTYRGANSPKQATLELMALHTCMQMRYTPQRLIIMAGTCICAYLLYSNTFDSAWLAMDFYASQVYTVLFNRQ
jgi:hypothetical protein